MKLELLGTLSEPNLLIMSRRAHPAEATSSKPKTFHVERVGARRRVRHVALADEDPLADQPIRLAANPASLHDLQALVDSELAQNDLFGPGIIPEADLPPVDGIDVSDWDERLEEHAEFYPKDSGQVMSFEPCITLETH